ncbi:RHS repeat domain-containing protein [Faecalispora jeddahensis]|uniref:RHS repeat domain-containing protein n=1 Tax=Faecalispora jeddahensis TaxID=1414721 RepID=UPI0027B927DD|nr:RHS repeat-associated core domain-containing protein [Faecalispora jeddahensis]
MTDPSNTSRYTDEDGFDMILTTGGSTDEYYTLSYQDGSKKTFTQSGYLRKIYDKNGNALILSYSGARLSTIADGAGRVTTLGYTSYGNLDSVTTPDGKITQFYYENNLLLNRIKHFDSKNTYYEYTNNLLTRAKDIDGNWIQYAYELNGSDWMLRNRVTSATEYSEIGGIGNTVSMTYGIDNTTKFEYKSALGKIQTETYSFDRYGRPVSIVNADSSAASYKYIEKAETNAQKNKIAAQAETSRPVVNLLKNHSAELTEQTPSWTLYRQGTSTGQMSIASGVASLGNNSLKVTQTQSGAGKVSAKQVITGLQSGQEYTFSAYVNTEGVSDGYANLFVQAVTGDPNPTEFIGRSGINGTTTTWPRISVTFTVPEGTTEISVHAGLINTTGTAWFDCLQLEIGNVANPYNLLENASLEYTPTGGYIPTYWTGANLEPNDGIFNKEMHIKGNPTKNKNLGQKIAVNKLGKEIAFVMSGKAKGNSIPTDAAQGRYFALDLGLIFKDGTKQWEIVPFNPDSNGEQYTTGPAYALPENREKIIERVEFYIIYYQNANSAYFYDMQLNMDQTGSVFTYNPNGQVITSRQNAYDNEVYNYSNAKELVNAKERNSDIYEYYYDENNAHRLKSIRSGKTKIGMYYSYDGKGNVIDTKMGTISNSGVIDLTVPANPYLQSTQGYSSNGNYRISSSDQRGNVTVYDIDAITGLIHSVTDPIGYQTSYTYNPDNYFLTGVSAQSSAGTVTVSYEYDGANLLNKITHNGFDYNFGYDGFGNTVLIKVGSQNLITHVYESGNGNLLYSVYGNSFRLDYGYDDYNRVISIKKNNAPAYRYDYDARGNLARVTDTTGTTPKITEFFYDLGDRLVQKTFGNDTEIRQGYDIMDRVISKYFRFANQTRLAAFSYNVDNRKEKTTLLSGGAMTFSYDTLNRLFVTDVNHVPGTDPTLRTQVDFVNLPGGNRTTTLTKNHFNYKRVGNANTILSSYAYTYDNNGNISTVTDAALNVTTYTYDQLNQLIRVDDQKAGVSTAYAYDTGGNLLAVTTYAYTTGALGTPVETISYSYDDDNWKDLLTNYDGQFLTYDQIGNSLAYRDGMSFTWAGRQLTTATVNGKTSSYTYNQEGIRTSKTVDGTLTDYLVDGSTIVAQRTGYDTLWFMYDSDGTRVGFTYHDDAYYYMKNAQGDVTGIVDSDLNVVVEYSYDAWGKLIETTGSEANLIGKLNPFLYRGYYYDAETGMYYLGGRYYDPVTGRFLNADDNISSGRDLSGINMFQYCGNNPIMRADTQGDVWHIVAGAVIGGLFAGFAKIASNILLEGKDWNDGLGAAVFFGAISGGLAASGVGLAGQVVANAAIGMTNNAIDQIAENKGVENFSARELITEGTIGAVAGKSGGAGTGSYALKSSAKLLNKNAVTALKNGTKNGVKAAIKRYKTSRPVKRFYQNLLKDMPKNLGANLTQTAVSFAVKEIPTLQGGNNVTIYPSRY